MFRLKTLIALCSVSLFAGCASQANKSYTEGYRTGDYNKMDSAVNRGANVNTVEDNLHALVVAIKDNKPEMVKFLLSKGANPNYATEAHLYPIHHAVNINSVEIVRALIDAGADVNLESDDFTRALYIAVAKKADLQIVKMLLNAGAKLQMNPANKDVLLNALSLAVFQKQYDYAQLIIESNIGQDFVFDLQAHLTPLAWAITTEDSKMANILLQGEIHQVNQTSYDGLSLLHLAVEKNQPDVVAKLIAKGADCHQVGYAKTHTPYQIAKRNKLDAILLEMEKFATQK